MNEELLETLKLMEQHIAEVEKERDEWMAEAGRMEKVCDSYAAENQRFHDRFTTAEQERDEARAALLRISRMVDIEKANDLARRSLRPPDKGTP